MTKFFFMLISALLILQSENQINNCLCYNLKPIDKLRPNIDTIKSRYICGFSSALPYTTVEPLTGANSGDDSIIENTFYYLWYNIIGGRKSAIEIRKDADQNNPTYKYAIATDSIGNFGNIQRQIFFKSKDLVPLLTKANGWFFKAICFHELGHQINCDPFSLVSVDTAELGADDYAGFMMGKLNATIDTVVMAYSSLTEVNPTNGYPSQMKRIASARAGWLRAHQPEKNSIAVTLVSMIGPRYYENDFVDIKNAVEQNAISLLAGNEKSTEEMSKISIESHASPGDFYLDSHFLYFKEKNGDFFIVGKVAPSNLKEYKWMIYDRYYNYMYIDKKVLVTLVNDLGKNSDEPIPVGHIMDKQ